MKRFLPFVPLVILCVGIWGGSTWIRAEHSRMEWWRIPVFWMSELAALFWYLYYLCGLSARGPLPPRLKPLIWLSFALGIGFDLAITVEDYITERRAYARSVLADEGEIVVASLGKDWVGGATIRWLECEFLDRAGRRHRATFVRPHTAFPDGLKDELIGKRPPISIGIRFDPQRPERCWLEGTSKPHNARLHGIGALVLFVTVLAGVACVKIGFEHTAAEAKRFPIEAAPFVAASFIWGMIGTMDLING